MGSDGEEDYEVREPRQITTLRDHRVVQVNTQQRRLLSNSVPVLFFDLFVRDTRPPKRQEGAHVLQTLESAM